MARPDLVQRQVQEDFFLYDAVPDKVTLLNPAARVVFELCDGTRTSDQIAAEVARLFDSDVTSVTQEVQEILADFAASELLTGNPGDRAPHRAHVARRP